MSAPDERKSTSWIAYVPPGSVQRGQMLVTSGDKKTVTCSICHGGNSPVLAVSAVRQHYGQIQRRSLLEKSGKGPA